MIFPFAAAYSSSSIRLCLRISFSSLNRSVFVFVAFVYEGGVSDTADTGAA